MALWCRKKRVLREKILPKSMFDGMCLGLEQTLVSLVAALRATILPCWLFTFDQVLLFKVMVETGCLFPKNKKKQAWQRAKWPRKQTNNSIFLGGSARSPSLPKNIFYIFFGVDDYKSVNRPHKK